MISRPQPLASPGRRWPNRQRSRSVHRRNRLPQPPRPQRGSMAGVESRPHGDCTRWQQGPSWKRPSHHRRWTGLWPNHRYPRPCVGVVSLRVSSARPANRRPPRCKSSARPAPLRPAPLRNAIGRRRAEDLTILPDEPTASGKRPTSNQTRAPSPRSSLKSIPESADRRADAPEQGASAVTVRELWSRSRADRHSSISSYRPSIGTLESASGRDLPAARNRP